MEIPVYSLNEILSMHEGHVSNFLRTLGIPTSDDNRGQIALKLNQLEKLSYPPPINSFDLAMLLSTTKDVVSTRVQSMIQLLTEPVSSIVYLPTPSGMIDPTKGKIIIPDFFESNYDRPAFQAELQEIQRSTKPTAYSTIFLLYGSYSYGDQAGRFVALTEGKSSEAITEMEIPKGDKLDDGVYSALVSVLNDQGFFYFTDGAKATDLGTTKILQFVMTDVFIGDKQIEIDTFVKAPVVYSIKISLPLIKAGKIILPTLKPRITIIR